MTDINWNAVAKIYSARRRNSQGGIMSYHDIYNGLLAKNPPQRLPEEGHFDRYLVIMFQRMRLKDATDDSGEWAWRKLCRRLA